jgi:hypothetical protein
MATPSPSVELLTPASDLVTGSSGVEFDLIFGRAGNDVFYSYDPIADANLPINIDIIFGDLFDNSPQEFAVILNIANGNPFAILEANLSDTDNLNLGGQFQASYKNRFVLGDEFQPYYTASNPLSLLTTNQFGLSEFAVLYDFSPTADTIQLNGSRKDYALLKVNGLPSPGLEQFSGYALFSLQTGLPDLVTLIVQKPGVTLDLKGNYFKFVGNKPKTKPQDRRVGQFGTLGLDFGYGVATDSAGNTYVTGSTSGSLFGSNKGSADVWLAKYDRTGNQVLALQFGGAGGDTPYNIVTDKAGNFYIVGSTGSSLNGFRDSKQSSDGSDAWVAKYSSNGTLLWGRQLGQNSTSGSFGFSTSGFGLQVDDNNNVYISGLTIRDNTKINPLTGKPFLDFPVEDDSFVIKFDSNGNQQWFTQIKDPNPSSPLSSTPFFDENYSLAVDKQGNSYLSGWTQGLVKESDPGRDLLKYDAWLSRVDANGQVLWTQQFGSKDQGLDFAWAVDTDSQGNMYVTGWTTGAVGTQSAGFYDTWLTKFAPNGTLVWAKQIGTSGDDGSFLGGMVIDNFDNIFISGYTNADLGNGDADKSYNAWVGRFDTNGNNQWIQKVGVKDRADYANRLAVSDTGKVVVTGYTEGYLGSSNNPQAQGAGVDAWVAELSVNDGKLVNFIGNTGGLVSITTPKAIATVNYDRIVTADKLPNGDNVIGSTSGSVDYGKLLPNLASVFDPRKDDSLLTAMKSNGILDTTMLNRTTKVDYKGTDRDDVYFGGSADDKLEGGKGTDILYGRGGNDEMKGNEEADYLYGGDGNDKLEGGDGDDILYGEAGNDEVKGGKGNDILTGIDPNNALLGFGEIDKLQGNENADTFVLGDLNGIYYLGRGNADYALIDDFKRDQGDTIQLNGSAGRYSLQTRMGANGSGLPDGTGILHNGDLIGIVKGVNSGLSLSDSSVFTFV